MRQLNHILTVLFVNHYFLLLTFLRTALPENTLLIFTRVNYTICGAKCDIPRQLIYRVSIPRQLAESYVDSIYKAMFFVVDLMYNCFV